MVDPVVVGEEGNDVQPDVEKTNIVVDTTADEVLEADSEPGYKKEDASEHGIDSGFEVDNANKESTSEEVQSEVDRWEDSVKPDPGKSNEDDSDDEPEDISLKEGKRLAEENRRKEIESNKSIKEMRKQKLKKIENRNALQQKEKRERKPTSVVPEKLDDDILKFVDNEIEINPEDIISTKTIGQKNKKIIFSDDEEGDGDNDDEDIHSDNDDIESQGGEIKQNKVMAKYINDVHKEENNSAREFLKNHFFGDRLKRDNLTKYMPVKKKAKISKNQCNTKWLKDRDTK